VVVAPPRGVIERGRGAGRLVLLLAAVGVAVAGVAAAILARTPAERTETGWVDSIDDRSLVDVRSFTLRTEDGRSIEFRVGRLVIDATSFPAGHLREHRLLNEPVVVTYREEDGALVAVRLQDAPGAGNAPPAHPSATSSS
jgi:hypothetical protein